jgi:hypothetical protein
VVENFLTIAREEGFNFKKYLPKAWKVSMIL